MWVCDCQYWGLVSNLVFNKSKDLGTLGKLYNYCISVKVYCLENEMQFILHYLTDTACRQTRPPPLSRYLVMVPGTCKHLMFLKRTFFLSKNLCWSQKCPPVDLLAIIFMVFVFFLRSVGCILYELFVGTPPFYTNSIFQLVNLICRVHMTLSVWYFLMCLVKTHE